VCYIASLVLYKSWKEGRKAGVNGSMLLVPGGESKKPKDEAVTLPVGHIN